MRSYVSVRCENDSFSYIWSVSGMSIDLILESLYSTSIIYPLYYYIVSAIRGVALLLGIGSCESTCHPFSHFPRRGLRREIASTRYSYEDSRVVCWP